MTRSMTKICITFSALAVVAAWAESSQAQTSQINGGHNNVTVGNVTQAQTSCNNETIKGEYAALANAWNGPNTPPYTATPPYTPFFALREVFFDGAGNFSSTGYKTTEGTPATFTLSGIYTVNADCTMMQTPPTGSGVTPTFFGVIAADSNKIYQIRTDAGTESIVFERVESVGQNENSQ
jgi:hypothetical protein